MGYGNGLGFELRKRMKYILLLLLAGLFAFGVMKCSEVAAVRFYPVPMRFFVVRIYADNQHTYVSGHTITQIRWRINEG